MKGGVLMLLLDFSRGIIQLVFITERQAHKLVQTTTRT
ncbi:hypothetical protein CHCC19467_4642 [Bacillus paralicheniformis]|nr:hypothetical protein CHCC19467_4642 [Bacillus paralicheniformis]